MALGEMAAFVLLLVIIPVAVLLFAARWVRRQGVTQGQKLAAEYEVFLDAIRKSDLATVRGILDRRYGLLYGPEGDRPLEVALEAGQPQALKLLMETSPISGAVEPLLRLLNRGALKDSVRASFDAYFTSLGILLPYPDLESLFSELVPHSRPEIVCVAYWAQTSDKLGNLAEKLGSALLTGGAITTGSYPCGLVALTPEGLRLVRLGLTFGNKLGLDLAKKSGKNRELLSFAFSDIPSVTSQWLDATRPSRPTGASLTLDLGNTRGPDGDGPGVTQIELPEKKLQIMVADKDLHALTKETYAVFQLAPENSRRGKQLAEMLLQRASV